MLSDYILLLIVFVLPLIYKVLFWLYTIQLKEYRFDRFKEYLFTPQGKRAIFNFWFFIEIPLLILSLIIFINPAFETIIYPMIFYFLIIQNIFVLGKVFRGKIKKPKITNRLIITVFLLTLLLSSLIYSIIILQYFKFIYLFIFLVLDFLPFLIFFVIFISLPLVNYLKNRIIKKAIQKTKSNKNTIKIGITGSFGKSSVKEFLSTILEQNSKILRTPNNINTELGVSNTIINELNDDYEYFVAEMGAYKKGEIDLLGQIVDHKFGFLTAVGIQHLGLFGSLDNIREAKAEIANKILENNGILYVNWDNENIRKIDFHNELNIIKYGFSDDSDAKTKIIEIKDGKTLFEFIYKGKKYDFEINFIGKHQVLNIAGIIAFCLDLGILDTDLKNYLYKLKLPNNTLEIKDKIINKSKVKIINDTYNLSIDGLKAGLDVLNSFSGNPSRVLVLDDILELGKESENIHFEIGYKIATKNLVDKIFYVGVNYKKSFIAGLIKGGFKEENILKNIDIFKDNSIILFEGRRAGYYLNNF